MDKSIRFDRLTMGVAYYPEHWDESLWGDDLRRMKETGISMMRVGEFAWSIFEPREGEFTFAFFDRFLALAQQEGMKVILGIPTATPPAWASRNYPEILNAGRDGILYRHGCRRHYTYNSPKYRELTARLTEQLARHYARHPAVAGWQVDNELNCELEEFYSDSDTAAFREFLREKYGTLDALNRAWGAVFWNQTYSAWDQVFVPRRTPSDTVNPQEQLDYLRFISRSARSFAKLQSDILRKYVPEDRFVTTNGMFRNLDYHRLTEESLDFLSYDSYPDFAFALDADPLCSDDLNDRRWGLSLSRARSVSPNFAVMEQQSGANGWANRMEAPAPKPGQLSLWTMQSVAHGADYVSYFRWRTSTLGTEIYWHGILDYCGRDNRRLREVRQTSEKFAALGDIAGARYRASFGYLRDYDNDWDAQTDRWHGRVAAESQKGWFNASQLCHAPMDLLDLRDDTPLEALLPYPLLVYPHPVILTEKRVALLRRYAEAGGVLLTGCRAGYKNESGLCLQTPMPGLLRELCGTEVEDFTLLGPADGPVNVLWDGEKLPAPVFNDVLEPAGGASVLGSYDGNYYAGKPGLTVRSVGSGRVYLFGGAFGQETAALFLKKLGLAERFSAWLEAPPECELALREKDGRGWLFALNYQSAPLTLRLRQPLPELFSGKERFGELAMAPYEVLCFQIH